MVTLGVNAALLLAFLATLGLELSPRLSRHPGRRPGTPEWRKDNLSLWDAMRVSESAKAQASAGEAALSETEWNTRGSCDLSAWLEPAPGEKILSTPLHEWLREEWLPGSKERTPMSRGELKGCFPPLDFAKLGRAVRGAPSGVQKMLGTPVMQRAFLYALHDEDIQAVERAAGEVGGVTKPRLVGHVIALKRRFFDRLSP